MNKRTTTVSAYKLFSRTPDFQRAMLDDIRSANQYIYLELYKFGNDEAGLRFREALTKKAREGVKVKVLLDSWGVTFTEEFFHELIHYGGEVRFFGKLKFTFDFFTKNHRRNHRKLLIIDDTISYIGSANITGYSIHWNESVLRLTGSIAQVFKKTFLESFKLYMRYFFNEKAYKKSIFIEDFEIVQDIPSIYRQRIKTVIERNLRKAKSEVMIASPYFLPGFMLRKILTKLSRSGVKVTVVVPRHSDVRAVDLLSNKYLGFYYKNGIKIKYYTPSNLHAKLILIDNKIFGVGSPNFDYRSFRYMHEIMLFGSRPGIVSEVRNHFELTLRDCIPFDYDAWRRRPRIDKILGWLLLPFRHLF